MQEMPQGEIEGWTEGDSQLFLENGVQYIPHRRVMIEALRDLIPSDGGRPRHIVELGAGGGTLAQTVLDRFPGCSYTALDGSETMLEKLRGALVGYGDHASARWFKLEEKRWRRELPRPLDAVLASLVLHHLTADGKREIFRDVAMRLETGGALLICDIVEPANDRARAVYADQWNETILEQTGEEGLRFFRKSKWNYYELGAIDPYDKPSPLAAQLRWLEEAGFRQVDCFWMHAGHAIYGGYK